MGLAMIDFKLKDRWSSMQVQDRETSINLASVGYLFQITKESLVSYLLGKIVSR